MEAVSISLSIYILHTLHIHIHIYTYIHIEINGDMGTFREKAAGVSSIQSSQPTFTLSFKGMIPPSIKISVKK